MGCSSGCWAGCRSWAVVLGWSAVTGSATASASGARRPVLPYDLADPVLARATWSRLAEPADRAAALLLSHLGATGALEWLLGPALDDDGQVRSAPAPPVRAPGDQARASAAWAKAASRWAPRLVGLDIRRELDVLERLGGSIIVPGDPWWPEALDDLDQPPACLWVRGDPALLACRPEPDSRTALGSVPDRFRQDLVPQGAATGLAVALVGSRAATRYGEQVALSLIHI